jgi:hypothetical protein
MTKKDPTTKLKALKEFISQFPQAEINDKVVEIYGKLYIQLSMDVDNLVREASQSALLTLINADKIDCNSAVMKNIFPSLLISMYDTHPVTASVAQNCFQKAFSNKDVGVILATCQEDVLENFTKNITVLTAQTICSTQAYSPEECNAKYERLVIGSLKGYGMYVEKVNKERLEEFKDKNLELINHEKFISLHKSKTPQIRSAYFETISNLLQHAPNLLIHVKEKLAAIVFKSIDESDPSISSHIWSCVLLTQIKIELWWTFINMKLFFEKLFIILRSSTNCSLIFPNLLPLVSNFKGVFQGNQLEAFHSNLMKNLHHGLTSDQSEKLLRSEFSSISSAYFEVLQFIIIAINLSKEMGDDEKISLCNRYMDDYMITTIFWCLNKKGSLPKKLIYQGIAKIIQYFDNNSKINVYAILYERFWVEIFKIIASSMETKDLKEKSLNHVELIKNLSPSSKKHVRMESDGKSEGSEKLSSKNLNILVHKICQIYIDKVNVTMEDTLIKSLESFIKEYQSSEMFAHLEKEYQSGLFDIFVSWLKDAEIQHESVIEIIAVLYKYSENSSKLKILNHWEAMTNSQKNWFICKALECPLNEDKLIKEFIRNSSVSAHIVEISKSLDSKNVEILRRCFKKKEAFPISDETCRNVVDEVKANMSKALIENKPKTFKINALFLTEIFPILSMCADKKDTRDKIFLTLFENSLNESLQDEDLIWEMIHALHDALSTLKIEKVLMEICLEIARNKLENVSKNRLEFIALFIAMVLTNAEELPDLEKASNLSYLSEISSHIEILQGNISKVNNFDEQNENFQEILNDTIRNNIFIANIVLMTSVDDLNSLKPQKEEKNEANFDDDDDNESESGEEEEISLKLYVKLIDLDLNIQNHRCMMFVPFINIYKNFYLLNILLKNGSSLDTKQKEWILYLEERLKMIISSMPDEVIGDIQDYVEEKVPNLLLASHKYSGDVKKLLNDSIDKNAELSIDQLKVCEIFGELEEKKILPLELLNKKTADIKLNVALMRVLIKNHLEVKSYNEANDKKVIDFSLNLLDEIITKNKASAFLLYKRDLNAEKTEEVLVITSIMNFLSEIIQTFPTKLNESQWDFVRLALSNWTLTLKKSCEKVTDLKIQAFIVSIFKLNSAFLNFITNEKVKSSSQLISSVIDEWQAIFSTDVNTILLQIFMDVVKNIGKILLK